jgi:hypothetical protein
MLVEAAGSVGRMKGANYLSAQHARLTARRGMGRAQVAVAHSILVSAYYMLSRDEPYSDLGADWLVRRNDEAHTAGWSLNSSVSATPSSSIRPPDPEDKDYPGWCPGR